MIAHSVTNQTFQIAPLRQAKCCRYGKGFTLVEMLVAMAVTLLMMAALARGFNYVGQQVKDSRADVDLSSQLRDVTALLSDELKRCTVTLQPAETGREPNGYFTYYEGPVTDVTSSLFRARTDASGDLQLDDARFGDFDDYIAFTAVADGDNWFYGKVPRYLLDAKTADLTGVAYPSSAFAADRTTPVVIRSKYAEIVYFVSPEYDRSDINAYVADPTAVDGDGIDGVDAALANGSIPNGIPDRMNLHRRVLLIRPDLNLSSGVLPSRLENGVNFMTADNWPSGTTGTATLTPAGLAGTSPANAWRFGMAGVHQQCDLSIRRVLNASGLPTTAVAANTLQDLSQPQNRFGHVRVPGNLLAGGGGASPTSMPVLALGPPASILSSNTLSGGLRLAPPLSPDVGPVVTPNDLSGFLRPEFVLGQDATHIDVVSDGWGQERAGEDVALSGILGFDIQIFDSEASFITTSNGLALGPSDAGYREAINELVANPMIERTLGGFVDLAYPLLAGGSLRGWQQRPLDRRSTANIAEFTSVSSSSVLLTQFSGVVNYTATNVPALTSYQPGLMRSGRAYIEGSGTQNVRLFQPTFDTFTNFFETDGFLQSNRSGLGTVWTTTITNSGSVTVDAGSDGLDNDGIFGPDDLGESETTPPFPLRPEAIRISVRLEDRSTRQVRQASIVHRDR